MIPGLTSVIIPCRDHAAFVGAAIRSALDQTAPVEIVFVDDGSTDGSADAAMRAIEAHGRKASATILVGKGEGPAAARNLALESARGEFVQFLDADDIIAPRKLETQLAEFNDETGFVLCDVSIVEPSGRTTTASKRYEYGDKDLNGWIQPWLTASNIIPIHAPLVRREAIGELRFPVDRAHEDWHFWHALSGRARARYVPKLLATYLKRAHGRNATTPKSAISVPGAVEPLRLNLGCGRPFARSWHPIAGLVNLDKAFGWRFEDGLPRFADRSVAGITVSHALMYVAEKDWRRVLREFARVLAPGGVVRITEDDTEDPRSSRRGGWKGSEPAVTLTGPRMARRHLEAAGFTVYDVDRGSTRFRDGTLMQAQHGDAPDCFWIEGVREAAVLFAPHNDDEALFAAFSILRYRPRVFVCYPSRGDYGDPVERSRESGAALAILGAGRPTQWQGGDLVAQMRAVDRELGPTLVLAPSPRASHPDHVAVAEAAATVFGDRVRRFHTYDSAGKVRDGSLVPHEPGWAALKARALACYRTQIDHPRARVFFDWDLAEYLDP